jgi:hypothetical protein
MAGVGLGHRASGKLVRDLSPMGAAVGWRQAPSAAARVATSGRPSDEHLRNGLADVREAGAERDTRRVARWPVSATVWLAAGAIQRTGLLTSE